MNKVEELLAFPQFIADISFEPLQVGQTRKEWVQDTYTDDEINYLLAIYAKGY